MTAETFINHTLPRVAPQDSVGDVLELMAETVAPELPLVAEGRFAGILSEEALSALPMDDVQIGSLPPTGLAAVVHADQHYFDVLRAAADAKTQLVGVIDGEGLYQGSVPIADLAAAMGNGIALQVPGGVLVLSIKERDYSLAEIARLVESNDAKILYSYIEADESDYQFIRVILRINKTDLSRVIATLERFGYVITARFHQSESPDLDQERLDSLMRFLDI